MEGLHESSMELRERIRNTPNYFKLFNQMRMWGPERHELLVMMLTSISDLHKVSKWFRIFRMVGCTVESFCTIYGICCSDNRFLNAATCFGIVAFFFPIAEQQIIKLIFDVNLDIVKVERKLFSQMEMWFEEHTEIKTELDETFSFDFTDEIEKYMLNVSTEMCYFPMELVKCIFSLKDLVNTPSDEELNSLIAFLQQSPVLYEICKMVLQYIKDRIKLPIYQNIQISTKKNISAPEKENISTPAKENRQAPDNESIQATDKENIQAAYKETIEAADKESIQVPAKESIQTARKESIQSPDKENMQVPDEEKVQTTKEILLSTSVLGRIILNGLSNVKDAYQLLRCEYPQIRELRIREEKLRREFNDMNALVLGNITHTV